MVHCGASGGQAALEGQQPDTDEAVLRTEFDFADLGREENQVLPSRCWFRELVSNTLSHESIQ